MSLRRVFIFICDICATEGQTESYGGASGFRYYYGPVAIEHICEDCQCAALAQEIGKLFSEDKKRFDFAMPPVTLTP